MRALAATVVLALACSDSPVDPGPPPPPPPPPPPDPTLTFDIDVRYVAGTNPTAAEQQEIDEAVAIWESVIVGDLPALQVTRPAGLCERVTAPAMDENVDDLVVWFEFGPIDGPRGTGAWGGVCELRANFLPGVGSVLFDVDDLPTFSTKRVVHELGHALGFGEVWDDMGLLIDPANPANGGPGFIPASADATISSDQPDQNFGAPSGSPISDLLVVGSGMGIWTVGPPDEELRALLKFDLSEFSFAEPIATAILILWDNATAGVDRSIRIEAPDQSWDEASVTWNTQPTSPGAFAGFPIPSSGCPVDGCQKAGSDMRDLVSDWLTGQQPNQGFMLTVLFPADPDFGAALHSRHDPDENKRPALYIEPKTHFVGPSAIAAYDAAGGAGSTYPKVPLTNSYLGSGESVDGHWNAFVLGEDYMAPQAGTKMSAITIGAMEDMGYEVDHSVADPLVVDPSRLEP